MEKPPSSHEREIPANNEGNNNSHEITRAEITRQIKIWVAIGITSSAAWIGWGRLNEYLAEPDQYIQHIEKYEPYSLTPEIERNLKTEIAFLNTQFSPRAVAQLASADLATFTAKQERMIKEELEAVGFDSVGIDNEFLKKIWNENLYPKGSIEDNVTRVEFTEGSKALNSSYHMGDAGVSADTRNLSTVINFYGHRNDYPSLRDTLETIDWHFSHELGHKNDWNNSRHLSSAERVDFLYEVSQAFKRQGSFRDIQGYVADIKNSDKQKEEYYKVVEWWGTLCEYYLTFPDIFKKDAPQEYLLVEKWLKKDDLQFDPLKAAMQRKHLIYEFVGTTPSK